MRVTRLRAKFEETSASDLTGVSPASDAVRQAPCFTASGTSEPVVLASSPSPFRSEPPTYAWMLVLVEEALLDSFGDDSHVEIILSVGTYASRSTLIVPA